MCTVWLLFHCSIVCLRFQVMQIKQVDCRMCTKNVNNYKLKTVRDFFGQLHIYEYKSAEKQIVRLQLNEKKSKESCQKGVGLFEIRRSRSRGWKNFGRNAPGGGGVLKTGQFSWTSY